MKLAVDLKLFFLNCASILAVIIQQYLNEIVTAAVLVSVLVLNIYKIIEYHHKIKKLKSGEDVSTDKKSSKRFWPRLF